MDGDCGHESRHRLLREVYDAANRGDFDALLARLPRHRPEEFIDVDDTTIALVSISYTDGRPDNHPAHVWRFRDELVARLEVFPQREEALEVHAPG